MKHIFKKYLSSITRVLRWLLALAVLGYVAYYISQNKQQLLSLKELSVWIVVALLFFNLSNNIIYALRFKMITQKKSGVTISYWSWMKFFLISRFLGLYAGQAGNIYRAAKLKSDYKVSITKYIAASVFITWFDTCLGFFMAFLVMVGMSRDMKLLGIPAWLTVLCILLVLCIAPLVFHWAIIFLKLPGRFFTWLHDRFADMSTAVINSLRDPIFILKLSATGMLSFINSIIVIHLCFRGLGLKIDLASAALFFTLLMLCNRVIITPGNLGIKELAYGVLAEQLGIGMTQGVLVSLIVRVITLLVTTSLGLACGAWDFLGKPSSKMVQSLYPDESQEKTSP
jgi:uncharacterized protein (TIRG00374 family)